MNKLSDEQTLLLRELDPLNIEARYPGYDIQPKLTEDQCEELIAKVEKFLCWIKKQL